MASPHLQFLGGTFGIGLGVSLLVVGVLLVVGCVTSLAAVPTCSALEHPVTRAVLYVVVGLGSTVVGGRETLRAWRPPR
ncbi:hypothetical protein ACFQPA_10660 [Halomarina halobia]|uniref:Uncharacterized protein n=1 Tax=Halomarina halobia TaxID=3033386 RepID=A0ABD6AA57_9EURY|nr:hypothetical protein [Halomarina sp. PSR21]